ncbi:MAG: hypothetical protein ABI443_07070 [Chthoniobacterales bacterium]
MSRFLTIAAVMFFASMLLVRAESDSDFIQSTPVNTKAGTGPVVPTSDPSGMDPRGVRANVAALPDKYKNTIIKISADGGKPNPLDWYITARNTDRNRAVYNVTIAHGDIRDEGHTRDPRAMLSMASPINIEKLLIDTDVAWKVAQDFVHAKGKTLGSISYVIEQDGKNATPTWSLWCYSPHNGYIGMVKILATTGDVITSK